MRRLKLLKINPISAFRAGLGFGLVIGIIAAIFYIFCNFAGVNAEEGFFSGVGRGVVGIFMGVLMGLLYMLGTAVLCLLYSLIYNITSKRFGSLEIEVSGD